MFRNGESEQTLTLVTCPVCKGTKVHPGGGQPCQNCGGQTRYGVASGTTFVREDGTPCVHVYQAQRHSRTFVTYRCTQCPFNYTIDSGD